MNCRPMLEGHIIVGVDFDGTITTEPEITPAMALRDDCKRVLTQWKERGVRLVLWTCRTGQALDDALKFLEENGMLELFDAVNDQLKEINELYYPNVARKLGADFYIDDKNLGCVVDWLAFEEQFNALIKE